MLEQSQTELKPKPQKWCRTTEETSLSHGNLQKEQLVPSLPVQYVQSGV